MVRFFDENEKYTRRAEELDSSVQIVLSTVFHNFCGKGYSIREISHVLMLAVHDIETIMILEIDHARTTSMEKLKEEPLTPFIIYRFGMEKAKRVIARMRDGIFDYADHRDRVPLLSDMTAAEIGAYAIEGLEEDKLDLDGFTQESSIGMYTSGFEHSYSVLSKKEME